MNNQGSSKRGVREFKPTISQKPLVLQNCVKMLQEDNYWLVYLCVLFSNEIMFKIFKFTKIVKFSKYNLYIYSNF